VVGESQVTGNGAAHAFLTSAGGLVSNGTDLLTLGGTNSVARAVNTSGQVAGYSQIAGDATQHAFLYTSGATVDLGTAAGFTSSRAYGVNDTGLVVGLLHNASGLDHAFVDASGVMLDLNTLNISGLPSGWYLDEALGINSSGLIVGAAIDANGGVHNFTLTPTGVPLPIPEPATDAALAGLSALGLALWRRRAVAEKL
jgi:probable HAF family extracellular repeat protein